MLTLLPTISFAAVILCWIVFAAVFVFRKKPEKTADTRRDRGSLVGVTLQGISYAVIWAVRRRPFTDIFPQYPLISGVLEVIAIVLAIGSVLFVMAAVRTLGKEWSLTARLVEGHRLATTGAYRFVRHPIYTGMLGMLVATGLVNSHWLSLIAGIIIFFIGTIIRVRSEEKLLRDAFGSDFDAYRRRVPAIVPGIF